jgi:hypothetical protein
MAFSKGNKCTEKGKSTSNLKLKRKTTIKGNAIEITTIRLFNILKLLASVLFLIII